MSSSSSVAFEALFPSQARREVLSALFSAEAQPTTAAKLARATGLTHRAVALELQRLVQAGLLEVASAGRDGVLVRAKLEHPMTAALRALVAQAREREDAADETVREALAAYGAPLLGVPPKETMSREDALLRGLQLARRDATVMRVLPVVLARQAKRLNWDHLVDRAKNANLRAEVGMLVDLAEDSTRSDVLKGPQEVVTRALADRRRKALHPFFVHTGKAQRRFAKEHTPTAAARWGFAMDITEESFRSFAEKHRG